MSRREFQKKQMTTREFNRPIQGASRVIVVLQGG